MQFKYSFYKSMIIFLGKLCCQTFVKVEFSLIYTLRHGCIILKEHNIFQKHSFKQIFDLVLTEHSNKCIIISQNKFMRKQLWSHT